MKLFEKLIQIAISPEALDKFLKENINEIIDFQNESYSIVITEKKLIQLFITEKGEILRNLNYETSYNKAFISILFDFCERFGFINTVRINSIITDNEIIIGHRLKSAKLYLLNITNNNDLINRFDEICTNLEYAFENEEDNEKKIDITFANYIGYVVRNTNTLTVNAILNSVRQAVSINNYKFISSDFIKSIIQIDYSILDDAFFKLQHLIESYFLRNSLIYNNPTSYLIEEGTNYVDLLESAAANFHSIRQISVNQFALIADNAIFYSLLRGVKIIDEPFQLFSYLNSYGPMHYKKLITSFEYLPEYIFNKNPHCIDWGCGQGMASMTLLEYLNDNQITQSISQITLIEPSQIALKRASLHVSKFTNNTKIINTINKDLDSLVDKDFLKDNKMRIHLFSNVLDMDVFSLSKLIELIKANFSGENYFLCVSPYITDLKTARIDSFVNAFSGNDGFEEFEKQNNKAYTWIQGKDWTRVLRVFKCII